MSQQPTFRPTQAAGLVELARAIMKELPPKELLTPEEAAAYLKVSVSKIRHEVNNIPCITVFGKPRYTKQALVEYFRNHG